MSNLISKFFDKTFWKFIIVGVINTFVGTAVMFIFYNLFHFNYWISSAANYFFGSIVSYFLNKYFTFKSKESSLKSIISFIINISICYLIAYGGAQKLVEYILSSQPVVIRDNISMLVGMGLFVILNYCGQRFIVFSNKDVDKESK